MIGRATAGLLMRVHQTTASASTAGSSAGSWAISAAWFASAASGLSATSSWYAATWSRIRVAGRVKFAMNLTVRTWRPSFALVLLPFCAFAVSAALAVDAKPFSTLT